MYLLSTGDLTNDYTTYISDALIFTFSIKPTTIPLDENYGFNLSSRSDETKLKIKVQKILSNIDTENKVTVQNTKIVGNKVQINLKIKDEEFILNV